MLGSDWAGRSTQVGELFRREAVWAENQTIVWRGANSQGNLDDGACYNPESDEWVEMSNNGTPSPSDGHSAIWTGIELIV